MVKSVRQKELSKIISSYLEDKPELIKALKLFEIGQAQYVAALSTMKKTEFISSNSTCLGGKINAELDRH